MNKETNKLIKEIFEMYESMTLNPEGKRIIKDIKEMYFEKEDYKSRIEKTIKYIEKKWERNHYYEDIDNCMEFCIFDKEDLLSILKGENNE